MIGVTGATGEVGRRVVVRLAERGVRQRLVARDPARVPGVPGAEAVGFGGFDDEPGMRTAFDGVETLLLVSAHESPDRVAQHRRAIDAAAAAGVARIVYTSFLGAAPDATFTFARDHHATEEHLRASGLGWTASRQSLYLDLLPVLGGADGVIRGPAGAGRLAPVLRDDVADALVAMLVGDGHAGCVYELTGPEAFSLAQLAAKLTAGGRPTTFEDETDEEARASRSSYGAPAWELDGWISTYTAIRAGEMDVVTDHVERLTGHPPASVDAFLA